MPSSWMLARLQQETEAFHATADAHRLAMLSAPTTVGQYRAWLSRIYGFEAAVEAALVMTPGIDAVLDVRGRCQMRLLRADLVSLGADPAALPRHVPIVIRDVADALGWIYVLERGSQLHGLVERHLRGCMPATIRTGGSYLAMQERSAGTRWRELGEAMDAVGSPARAAERICTASKLAFRHQRDWLEMVVPESLQVA
jgi:heme oxygenase